MTKQENKAFYKKLLTLSLPISVQSLMLALVAACDALMLGRVEQHEMTAVSLATQVQFIQNMFVFAASGAGAILGAQYYGKGDKRTMSELFSLMLRFCCVISLIFFAACELMPRGLMHIFSSDEVIISTGAAYLRIAGWSYLITGISQCYLTMMKVTDRVKASALMPAMNARGAALATTISRVIELAMCIFMNMDKDHVRPKWSKLVMGTGQLTRDFLKQYIPLMGGSFFWGVGFTSYTAIIGHIGSDAAAANSVASVIRDLICCICNGIGSAAGIIVGNELGAGRLWQKLLR